MTTTWYIDDYAVLYLLYVNNYIYERCDESSWYRVYKCPVPLNGCYELPGGFVIESIGARLRATKKEQGEQ